MTFASKTRFQKKNISVLCEPKELRFAAIDEHRGRYRLFSMCSALRVTSSGYHAWRKRPLSARKIEEWKLIEAIETIHRESRERYGSLRIHAVLNQNGETIYSRSRTARLMRKHGIKARTKMKFKATTNSQHKLPVAENILNRDFNPDVQIKFGRVISPICGLTKDGFIRQSFWICIHEE